MEIDIRTPEGCALDAGLARKITARVRELGRFGLPIRQVVVSLDDMAKPAGTPCKRCYLLVRLRPDGAQSHGQLTDASTHMNLSVEEDYHTAFCLAMDRLERMLEREFVHRRF
ncbi:MAG: hypothetical protein ACOY3Z_07080 [Thermodesulfobacteriota bacterium]